MTARHERALAFLASLGDEPPQLPFEPALLARLFADTAQNSEASIDDIAALVNRSQGLAAKVLRRANSAYYGLRSQVSSLSHAVRLLGLNEVRTIILGLGLTGAFKAAALPKGFALETLWEHQVLTAQIARELASFARVHVPALADLDPEELYAAGLLHDLGKILIASRNPEDWQAIAALAAERGLPLYQAEDLYWGLDHSVVASRVLTFWQLPARLAEPVGWHHAPALAEEAYAHAARMLAIANMLAHCQADTATVQPPAVLPPDAAALVPPSLDQAALLAVVTPCFNPDTLRDMTAWFMER